MRCVCLREPWLYLMLELPAPYRKNVENRAKCLTRALGPILVKSSAPNRGSKKFDYSDSDAAYCERTRKKVVEELRLVPAELFPAIEQLQFGGIRGAFNFNEMLTPNSLRDRQFPWKFPECFGYVVDRAHMLPFRPLKGGAQGIFYPELVDSEVMALRAAGLLKEAA